MKSFLLASFVALTTLACGSTPPAAFQVKSVDNGSVVDRFLNLQESLYALIAESPTADDAIAKITAYCEQNAAAVERMIADRDALADDPDGAAQRAEFERRGAALSERAEKELSHKNDMLADGRVLDSMSACLGPETDDGAPE